MPEVPPRYPECDKMSAVHEKSQSIGEFLEWIGEQGFQLAKYHRHAPCCSRKHGPQVSPEKCPSSAMFLIGKLCGHDDPNMMFRVCGMSEERLYVECFSVEDRLAEFFGIDLRKVETERRAMLANLRVLSKAVPQ